MKMKKLYQGTAIALSLFMAAGTVLPVHAAEKKNEVTAQQQALDLTGVGNARQLGGYETKDGRHVKKNLLLRTAKLSTASKEDLQTLKDTYNLGYVVDFRTTGEAASEPDPEIPGVVNQQIRIIEETEDEGSLNSMVNIYGMDSDNPAAPMLKMLQTGVISEKMYVDFAFSEYAQKGYREFFQILLNNKDEKAVLWHCTGGKDRAGTAAVLVLSALGVDRETILDDFALTNDFNTKSIQYMGTKAMELTTNPEEINGVMYLVGVNRDYMELLLDTIDETCGSMDQYLATAMGLSAEDIAQLQAMYLE